MPHCLRTLKTAIFSTALLTCFSSFAQTELQTEALSRIHTVENTNIPQHIQRVFSTGGISDVLLISVAPEKLVNIATPRMNDTGKRFLSRHIRDILNIGRLTGRGATAPLEKVIELKPDIILDAGEMNRTYLSLAERVQQQTRIPYILIDGGLSQSAQQLRQAGELLGVKEWSEKLAFFAQKVLDRTHNIARHKGIKIYSARGADGLETGLAGSIHTEVLEWLGATNAATLAGEKLVTRVSLEQIIQWQPDVIITHDPNFYQKLQTDTLWQKISAVKNRQVFLIPVEPFGWLDMPPGVNRLLGCIWLAHKLAPESMSETEYSDLVKEYFQLFYGYPLSDQEAEKFKG